MHTGLQEAARWIAAFEPVLPARPDTDRRLVAAGPTTRSLASPRSLGRVERGLASAPGCRDEASDRLHHLAADGEAGEDDEEDRETAEHDQV
jgi:hypothetical protein